MPDVELRSKTELTSITGTEFVYLQKQTTPFTVSPLPVNIITNYRYSILAKRNATNPNYQLDIVVNGASYTMDITTVGALGRDSATAEAVSTWYYIFEIVKADNTKSVIFSTSPTAPTLPAGYIYSKLVSMVRNDSSGNFVDFVQHDNTWGYGSDTPIRTVAAVDDQTAGLSASQWIPLLCYNVDFRLKISSINASNLSASNLIIYNLINAKTLIVAVEGGGTSPLGQADSATFSGKIFTDNQKVYYETSAFNPGGTTISTVASISGFEVPL